jgi:hypothetical protein
MLKAVGDMALLTVGVMIVWMGIWSWRRPERVPGLMAGAPVWAVRCCAVGWVLIGCAVGAFGGLSLADRESDRLVGPLRLVGVLVVFLSTVVAVAFRRRKRRTS